MAGQLNPFRLRAPSVSVSASDLMKGQELLGSHLQGGITGLSQFGKQANTNELTDLIAKGQLEGMSTDEAQQAIAELGLTGGVTKDMGTFMEQGHQGRQQEDRQRQQEAVASTLFDRQAEKQSQKQSLDKDLWDYQKANPKAKGLINTGDGIYDPNTKEWIIGKGKSAPMSGDLLKASKNSSLAGQAILDEAHQLIPDLTARRVQLGTKKDGKTPIYGSEYQYLSGGKVYNEAGLGELLTSMKTQEQPPPEVTIGDGGKKVDTRAQNPNIGAETSSGYDKALGRTTDWLSSLFEAKDPVQEMRDARALKAKIELFEGKDEASNTSASQLFTGGTNAGKADELTQRIVDSQKGTGVEQTKYNRASESGTKAVLDYFGKGVTNKNDSSSAPSPDMTNLTGETVNALKYLSDNSESFNVNSTWGGKHSSKSGHYLGQGVDINRFNGKTLRQIGELEKTSLEYKSFKEKMRDLSKQEGVQFLLTPVGEFKNGKFSTRVSKGHDNHIHIETTRKYLD